MFPDWVPLWSERATDLADIRKKHAEAVKALSDAGVVDKVALGQAVVSQAEDDGWLPTLGQHVAAAAQRQPGTSATGE